MKINYASEKNTSTDSELFNQFVAEMDATFDGLNTSAAILCEAPKNKAQIDELLRLVQSVRILSEFFDVTPIESLAKKTEDFLLRIAQGEKPLPLGVLAMVKAQTKLMHKTRF